MQKKKRPLIRPKEAGDLDPEQIRAVVRAVHVLPTEDGWQVRKGGKKRICILFETPDEAEKYAQRLATNRKVGVVVHSRAIPKLQSTKTFGKQTSGVLSSLKRQPRKISVKEDTGVSVKSQVSSKPEK
jgi:hypothetical protein